QGRHAHGRSLRFESQDDILIAKNALAQVGAAELSDRWMDQISGGEKQRVILARALAQQPLLLLLDEPTLHLDIAAQIGLLDSLRRLAAENRYTVVVVTHELNLAAEYADQVVLMQRGRCLRVGPPASIYQRELLEQVFHTPLTVELGSAGRSRNGPHSEGPELPPSQETGEVRSRAIHRDCTGQPSTPAREGAEDKMKITVVQKLFLSLLLSLVFPSFSLSQSALSDAHLQGTLLDATGAGVGGAHVTAQLDGVADARIWAATSAADG